MSRGHLPRVRPPVAAAHPLPGLAGPGGLANAALRSASTAPVLTPVRTSEAEAQLVRESYDFDALYRERWG